MNDEASRIGKEVAQGFINSFAKIYPYDPAVGITMSISVFVSCYAMMTAIDRLHSLEVLLNIVKQIGTETFEDGFDFVDFMKQMIIAKKEEE